jgi:[NiFe] hydrogenase assembly HybE family chaperone
MSDIRERVARLCDSYEATAERMKALPIFNAALRVEAIGFQDFGGGLLGVLVTPWFMNLVFLPRSDGPVPAVGEEMRTHLLPAGPCEFMGTRLEGVGPIESCSLLSPMVGLESQEEARSAAIETLRLLFTPRSEAGPARPFFPSRRELLQGILRR